MKIGSGPASSVSAALSGAAAYTFGLPISLGQWIGVPLVMLIIAVALVSLLRKRHYALFAFFFVGLFTAVVPMFWRPENMQLFPRYFILNLALVLPLSALLVGKLLESGSYYSILALTLLISFVCGNAILVRALATYGRGEYKKVVMYMAEHSPPGQITVGGDNDFRNFIVLGYYEQSIRPDHWFTFYKFRTVDMAGPQWLLVHRRDGAPSPDPDKPGPLGPQYRLAQTFRHAALSGFDWYLDQNVYLIHQ